LKEIDKGKRAASTIKNKDIGVGGLNMRKESKLFKEKQNFK
jgi:hypothetical protein